MDKKLDVIEKKLINYINNKGFGTDFSFESVYKDLVILNYINFENLNFSNDKDKRKQAKEIISNCLRTFLMKKIVEIVVDNFDISCLNNLSQKILEKFCFLNVYIGNDLQLTSERKRFIKKIIIDKFGERFVAFKVNIYRKCDNEKPWKKNELLDSFLMTNDEISRIQLDKSYSIEELNNLLFDLVLKSKLINNKWE
ncbi:MAG: hypothetical protein N2560_08290 [Ignavibacteria bacterium]|nr:hypothetical protein [Ignavibacteria bacterium]